MKGDVRSTLGKRSSQDFIRGETEHAQFEAIRIPSARKRLKMDASMPLDLTAALPSASDAALPSPTEHAQMDIPPATCTVARKYEMGKKEAFPVAEWDESNDKKEPLSLTHRIVR
jgi:hypothetical protein